MDALVEEPVPGYSFAVFKRTIAVCIPFLEKNGSAVLLTKVGAQSFFKAATEDQDASDAKPGHNNPLSVIRNALEILNLHRLCFIADDPQDEDTTRRTLKSIYGYQDGGPEPYGWRQMSLTLSKLLTSAELRKEKSENPPEVKQFLVEAISDEIIRLVKLQDSAAAAEALRRDHNLATARIPSQEVSDRLIRYEAHLSREFDRTLAQLERLQRMRLGQPVLPKLEVRHSLS
jgi:hypothetical protein